MGCGKPNDEDNPPATLRNWERLTIPITEIGPSDFGQISHGNHSSVADFMSFPYVSSHPPWENLHETCLSYTQDPRTLNDTNDFMSLGTLPNPQMECNFIDHRGYMGDPDACASGFNNPQVNMTLIPTQSITAGCYQMNRQERNAKGSGVNWPQISQSALTLGCSTSMSRGTRDNVLYNDVKASASHPEKFDGSFLTLGIGGNTECQTKTKFSSREIASKLEEAVCKQSNTSNLQQTTPNFSSLIQKPTGVFLGIHKNPGGLRSPICNLGSWTSSSIDDKTVHLGAVGPSPNPSHSPVPEAFKQYNFLGTDTGSSLLMRDSTEGYFDLDSSVGYAGDPALCSLPVSSITSCFSHPGFAKQSELASESAKSSSITQDYLGVLNPPTEGRTTKAVESGSSSTGVQPIGSISSILDVNTAQASGNSTFPEKIKLQNAEGSILNPTTSGQFPRRLGVQLGDASGPQPANQGVLPRVIGVQTRSNVYQSQNSDPVQHAKNLLGQPPALGCPQDSLADQVNVQGPPMSTGPVLCNAKVDMQSQVSKVAGQPSLKRRASNPPPIPSWGQRRKLVHVTHSQQGTPATLPPPAHSVSPYIRWRGFDAVSQPFGRKCLICKRDLSFTPEGPITLPSVPPAVAVLPCGHTFHDHCLQLITVEEQSKDPPCIPCAMGET